MHVHVRMNVLTLLRHRSTYTQMYDHVMHVNIHIQRHSNPNHLNIKTKQNKTKRALEEAKT